MYNTIFCIRRIRYYAYCLRAYCPRFRCALLGMDRQRCLCYESNCWTIAKEAPSPLPCHLGFMVGLAGGDYEENGRCMELICILLDHALPIACVLPHSDHPNKDNLTPRAPLGWLHTHSNQSTYSLKNNQLEPMNNVIVQQHH
jgi:hypothetical protein